MFKESVATLGVFSLVGSAAAGATGKNTTETNTPTGQGPGNNQGEDVKNKTSEDKSGTEQNSSIYDKKTYDELKLLIKVGSLENEIVRLANHVFKRYPSDFSGNMYKALLKRITGSGPVVVDIELINGLSSLNVDLLLAYVGKANSAGKMKVPVGELRGALARFAENVRRQLRGQFFLLSRAAGKVLNELADLKADKVLNKPADLKVESARWYKNPYVWVVTAAVTVATGIVSYLRGWFGGSKAELKNANNEVKERFDRQNSSSHTYGEVDDFDY